MWSVELRLKTPYCNSIWVTLLIADGVRYMLYEPKTETEFENLVRDHITEIFGIHSILILSLI